MGLFIKLDPEVYLVQALIALQKGDDSQALVALRKGLRAVKQHANHELKFISAEQLESLCRHAEIIGLESELRSLYTQELNAGNKKLKFITLGDFQIHRLENNTWLQIKITPKPLEIIKYLIANGPRSVSKEKICDALWPDTDGDLSQKSFNTTLHRLRKYIGHDLVMLTEGRLSLNRDYCKIDIWDLEEFLKNDQLDYSAMNRALKIYQGLFLQEVNHHWVVHRREKIRRLFTGAAIRIASEVTTEAALDLLKRAIDREPFFEPLYQKVIALLMRNNRYSEAMQIYRQCKKLLDIKLSTEPSEKTKKLIQQATNRFNQLAFAD